MHEAIDRVIEAGQFEALAEILETARTPDVRYAIKQIARFADGDEMLLEQAVGWAKRSETVSRQVACGLLPESYRHDSVGTISLLLRLADDSDWTVRESAGDACGRLLRKDFTGMMEVLREWREHPSENVRKAVVIAAMKAAKTRRLEWAEPLLKLIEPLLFDRHPHLRRNLGPLALGGALLFYYPDMTFEYLVKWSTSNDEQVLWNVAMAFSASAGPLLVKKALIILRKLSLDERRYVWRAVAAAMWKLGRKKPEIVRPELTRWLEDERRVNVAREALKFL